MPWPSLPSIATEAKAHPIEPMNSFCRKLSLALLVLLSTAAAVVAADTDQIVRVPILRGFSLAYEADLPDAAVREGLTLREQGRMVETVVDLPPMPIDQRDAMQITATVQIMPSLIQVDGGYQAGDPWPRVGTISVLVPDGYGNLRDVELMRLITGYGGAATYSADLTALAPLLHGRTIIRAFIDTYTNPAWEISLTLSYTQNNAGFRRPALASPVFNHPHVTAQESVLRSTITIPEGLNRPRLRILSTGHATDGRGGDEFVPRTHILRIDGEEVARWRPWAEQGNVLRPMNPTSGRAEIDGREIWSSDFDRSGWHPGLIVKPLIIPAAELTPGQHEIELEILNIRAADLEDEKQEHGYWRLSMIVVADEPWPGRAGIRRGGPQREQ